MDVDLEMIQFNYGLWIVYSGGKEGSYLRHYCEGLDVCDGRYVTMNVTP